MAVVNQNEVFTARTESQLLTTSKDQTQQKKITAETSSQLNQTKSVVLQGHVSSTGKLPLNNLIRQNFNPEMQVCTD